MEKLKSSQQKKPTQKFFFQKAKSAGDSERKSLDFQGKKKLVL